MADHIEVRLAQLILLIVVACGGFLHGYWSVELIIDPNLGGLVGDVFIANLLVKLMVGIERAALYTLLAGTVLLIVPMKLWRTGFWQPPSEE